MFELTVVGTFAAEHQLRLSDGSWETPHGHAWHVRVTVAGAELDEHGLLVDFHAVERALEAVLAPLAGQRLNGVEAFAGRNPTAEIVALHIADELQQVPLGPVRLKAVEVEEAPGCWARYLP